MFRWQMHLFLTLFFWLEISASGCVIKSFSEVNEVVKNCTDIIVEDLKVPSGVSLELHLLNNASLTFRGNTSFGYEKDWTGFLVSIKGSGLTIRGAPDSILDGQGIYFWKRKAKSKPKFLRIEARNSTFTNISLLNCPIHCVSITNSSSLELDAFHVNVSAGNIHKIAHNTDGFDISESTNIIISNSTVVNQDDCIAVNSGSDMYFTRMVCSGGHGLSLSVGLNATDSSKNELSNITFHDSVVKRSRNGIHFKTHKDGAKGFARNVTYSDIRFIDIYRYGVNVQQNYGRTGGTGEPSNNILIEGLKLVNVTGNVTGRSKSYGVYVLCGNGSCTDFNWNGVSISSHEGNYCNYKPTGFNC